MDSTAIFRNKEQFVKKKYGLIIANILINFNFHLFF